MMMEKFRDCIDAVFLRRNPEFFVKSIFHGNFFIIIMIFFAAVFFNFFSASVFFVVLSQKNTVLCLCIIVNRLKFVKKCS